MPREKLVTPSLTYLWSTGSMKEVLSIFVASSIIMGQISFARIRIAIILLNLNFKSSTACSLTINRFIQSPSNMDFLTMVCCMPGSVPTKTMDMLS